MARVTRAIFAWWKDRGPAQAAASAVALMSVSSAPANHRLGRLGGVLQQLRPSNRQLSALPPSA